ncbi:hypothetical protein SISSUDRAFT_1033120 [Sistotremastrum suecicum HHB10207 ss-3]|uniref:Glycosyl transferase family 25 domain-containing protein n=1 Tax=Sistotremastrum suecicum HHB10207 ss-3 TaxID=1314776 RepID=A0A166DP60_9AGAM|nr:hypothetical protein SISSUDRAFT_1033120 [Sistotremastrum suecicum HHB10207 ss-3]
MLRCGGGRRIIILSLLVAVLFIALISSLSTAARYATPHTNNSSTLLDEDEAYRARISAIRSTDTRPHSKTLGVADNVYLITLPQRTDRRERMDKIARALDITFTYFEGTDHHSERVAKIMDRVKWQRGRIDDRDAEPADWPEADTESHPEVIFDAYPFQWSSDVIVNQLNPLNNSLGIAGSDYWTLDPPDPVWEASHPLPSTKDKKMIMTTIGFNDAYKNVALTNAMIGCWDSHARLWRKIVENGDKVAIIFEDDIDMEFDIEKRILRMWPALPKDWDVVMLGHCWSAEYENQPLPGSIALRPMYHTLCTHAYAVSSTGVRRLIRHARSPDLAYSRPVDHVIKDLTLQRRLKTFSVYPQIVIQTKESISDVVGDRGIGWKEALLDSTLERIRMESGEIPIE